eukprot:g1269.t1
MAGSVRAQLGDLEATLANQSAGINEHTTRVSNLQEQTVKMARHIDDKMNELRAECARQIEDFKDEANRKFSLQIAENKRLNAQMSRQRKESQRLVDRIHALEERCRALEQEVGGE